MATIDGDRYKGNVTDTERWKCELNQGFLESGSISIYLRLDAETASRYDIPSRNIRIGATEKVPNDWDAPKASIYDPTGDEMTVHLGVVTDIEVLGESIN